jgi:hypothetical protein
VSAYGKPSLIQSAANARKVARTFIRLKHSVAADNELNEVMPVLEMMLERMLHEGKVPALSMADIEKAVMERDA